MKEEIINRATINYKLNIVYNYHLPHEYIQTTKEGDLLRRAIIYAINEVIKEWCINGYDVEPYCKGESYGMYWN